jgi:MerR family transcriptional regulator, redox-sensitive transcriptional activator SoxR
MSRLSISDVARQTRLRPSAIRYYEKLGILPKAERMNGRRRYDRTVLYPLAVIQIGREAGFSLDEIRTLFFGFQKSIRPEARWRRLADRKLKELDILAERIRRVRILLRRMKTNCHCKTLETCGQAILETGISRVERPYLAVIARTGTRGGR